MAKLTEFGVQTVIVTDISRDGAMKGTNRSLYAELSENFPALNVIASGGVSSLDDVKALTDMDIYGAIIGKAYYTGAIDLRECVEASKK
jgi:phosphoribosylformimino-5-aminoimidazole carboxamide ribotide isomerase